MKVLFWFVFDRPFLDSSGQCVVGWWPASPQCAVFRAEVEAGNGSSVARLGEGQKSAGRFRGTDFQARVGVSWGIKVASLYEDTREVSMP